SARRSASSPAAPAAARRRFPQGKETAAGLVPSCRLPPLPVDALVLVLRELALLDALLPARTVALLPAAAAELGGERGVVPGAVVGLALVLALLVHDDLLLLAARGECEQRKDGYERGFHDLPLVAGAGCCTGGCAPGLTP